jgi:RHS repeat-associated protein
MKIELDKEVDAAPTEFTVKLASESPRAAKGIDSFVRMALYVTDEVGNKVRSTEYDPFGNWHKAQGQANIHMLFQGQQQDPESSLYYMRARYYDPFIGRFISKDPVKGYLTIPQTQNPYIYSLNNPINLSDPSGLDAIGVCNCVSGGVGVWGAASSCNVTTPNGSGKVNSTTQGGSAYDIVSVGKSLYYNWDDNVKNVSDLYGTSNVLGFNVGPVDVTFEKNTETNKVTAVEVQIGKGISTPIGIHGGVNQSSPPVSSGAW